MDYYFSDEELEKMSESKVDKVISEDVFSSATSAKNAQINIEDKPIELPDGFSDDEMIDELPDESVSVNDLISGEIVVTVLDGLLSSATFAGAKALKLTAKKKEFEANNAEKTTLTKATNNYLKSINVSQLDPLGLLIAAILGIYGSKLGAAYIAGDADKKADEAYKKGFEAGRRAGESAISNYSQKPKDEFELTDDYFEENTTNTPPKRGRGRPRKNA